MKRLAVLTSGGDAQGMNAAVRSVVRTALAMDAEIYGIERGYAGLLDEDITPMTSASVGGIVLRGGTMLRTARCQAFFERKNPSGGYFKEARHRRARCHRRRRFCAGGRGFDAPRHPDSDGTGYH